MVLMVDIQEVANALEQPTSYSHSTQNIERITTGASLVFLTGNTAYKINKPVNFGFLDFSSLVKRKVQCEKEVSHNSLLSADIYQGVSTVTKDEQGNIRVDGKGEIVEYAVRMNQMDPHSTMDEQLRQNNITEFHLKELAHKIHAFHQHAPEDDHIRSFGSLEAIQYNWNENFEQTEPYIGNMIEKQDFNVIKEHITHFMEKNEDLLQLRVQKHKIKHCHGDFHSQNVFITEKGSHIFDGIVFNQRFPCSDVIAEIAFMSMDLEYHHHDHLSKVFINEYQKISSDIDIPRLLDFYKCYRAYIRAKINCFTYADPHLAEDKKQHAKSEAHKYFLLAKKYAEKLER